MVPADMIPKRSRGSGGCGNGDGQGGGSGRSRGGGIPEPCWSLACSGLVLLPFSSNNVEGVRIRGNLWDGRGGVVMGCSCGGEADGSVETWRVEVMAGAGTGVYAC
jgi:hypothetical protein